jgi:hypothetical protein
METATPWSGRVMSGLSFEGCLNEVDSPPYAGKLTSCDKGIFRKAAFLAAFARYSADIELHGVVASFCGFARLHCLCKTGPSDVRRSAQLSPGAFHHAAVGELHNPTARLLHRVDGWLDGHRI